MMEVLPPAQIIVVRLHILGARFLDLLLLSLTQDYTQRFYDSLRDVVLDREHILHLAVVSLGPEVVSVRYVHELRSDAELAPHLAYAALEHSRDLELPPNLTDVLVLSLEGERRRPGRHTKRLDLAQCVDDLFGHTVGEVFVLRIGTHVRERQHGDRFCCGYHGGRQRSRVRRSRQVARCERLAELGGRGGPRRGLWRSGARQGCLDALGV